MLKFMWQTIKVMPTWLCTCVITKAMPPAITDYGFSAITKATPTKKYTFAIIKAMPML